MEKKAELKEFILTQSDNKSRQVSAYLTKVRGLEPTIVSKLLKEKLQFQNKEERNGRTHRTSSFVGYDMYKIQSR